MLSQQLDDESRQWDDTATCPGLGVGLVRDVPGDLDRDPDYAQAPGRQIDGIPAQARALAPPQTGPAG